MSHRDDDGIDESEWEWDQEWDDEEDWNKKDKSSMDKMKEASKSAINKVYEWNEEEEISKRAMDKMKEVSKSTIDKIDKVDMKEVGKNVLEKVDEWDRKNDIRRNKKKTTKRKKVKADDVIVSDKTSGFGMVISFFLVVFGGPVGLFIGLLIGFRSTSSKYDKRGFGCWILWLTAGALISVVIFLIALSGGF